MNLQKLDFLQNMQICKKFTKTALAYMSVNLPFKSNFFVAFQIFELTTKFCQNSQY